jgi:hypothetical protein
MFGQREVVRRKVTSEKETVKGKKLEIRKFTKKMLTLEICLFF